MHSNCLPHVISSSFTPAFSSEIHIISNNCSPGCQPDKLDQLRHAAHDSAGLQGTVSGDFRSIKGLSLSETNVLAEGSSSRSEEKPTAMCSVGTHCAGTTLGPGGHIAMWCFSTKTFLRVCAAEVEGPPSLPPSPVLCLLGGKWVLSTGVCK